MGRSPAFSTRSRTASRPAFNSMPPSERRYTPGTTTFGLPYGIVDGDELRAVGERALDLDFVNHLRHSFHHVVTPQDLRAERHQVRHRSAVADPLEHFAGDERNGLGMVQLQAPCLAPPGDV